VTGSSGRGDPARMELLWGSRKRPSRGPKPGLSVERIVQAAIEVADASGLAALSMRRVADELGVGTMSLYTYVPGKAELLGVMLDTVLGETPTLVGTGGGWRADLELGAREHWELYHRHPWVLRLAGARAPLGPNQLARYDAMLAAVSGVGLTGTEMVLVVSLVGDYVRGAARSAVEAAAELSTGQSDDQSSAEHEPLLAAYLDTERFPTATRLAQEGAFEPSPGGAEHNLQQALDSFEFGLQRVLDGIEALIEDRAYERARARAREGG
jgi:AcrR family transcriptional regulator